MRGDPRASVDSGGSRSPEAARAPRTCAWAIGSVGEGWETFAKWRATCAGSWRPVRRPPEGHRRAGTWRLLGGGAEELAQDGTWTLLRV